jgi:fatty-acyl-CoA synthase
VVALVQRAPGTSPSAETLNEHASAVLARYKLPKEVIFLDHIERSPSGKADYRWAAAQVSSA